MLGATHPIWSLLRLVILMLALLAVLYLTASSFDATELKTLVTMFLVASGVEAASQLLPKR